MNNRLGIGIKKKKKEELDGKVRGEILKCHVGIKGLSSVASWEVMRMVKVEAE